MAMMVDILLEEDGNSFSSSPEPQTEDVLLTEQARQMFLLCDHNGKGFVVKMDLARIDGMIPNISQQQLELFFDNADIFKTNYITENQFIQNIKPMLLRNAFSSAHLAKTKEAEEGLYFIRNDGVLEENSEKIIRENEQKINKKGEISEINEKQQQQYSGYDGYKYRHSQQNHQSIQRQQIYNDSIESQNDELKRNSNGTVLHVIDSVVEYPFTVDNTDSLALQDSPQQSVLNLNDLRKQSRKTINQLNSHKYICFSEVKSLPKSRSLADELLEHGTINKEEPSSVVRSDFLSDRIFKVVFVGDSAISFDATIGVDFTVKRIHLYNRVVTVQLWDTAGQERFRSITKQYYRKADGVILMYDVTSEQSFLNVRNWITSVKAGVDERCVMCLVGNKVDLFANDQARILTYKHGKKLAQEFGMLFFETSAFNGFGISDCMKAVAGKLQEREDEQLQNVLKLDMNLEKAEKLSLYSVKINTNYSILINE
ncbi:Ras and EF-hand domain-containing protein [Dirofilaria immitis]|nr:Ras and EF-hand domain-containing protein [Dirofilaria immitis]